MKAILCIHLGGPDDLVLADLPTPVARAGEAVVRIKAVGLKRRAMGKVVVKP